MLVPIIPYFSHSPVFLLLRKLEDKLPCASHMGLTGNHFLSHICGYQVCMESILAHSSSGSLLFSFFFSFLLLPRLSLPFLSFLSQRSVY